ncbi:hypothetical protein [Ruminococcus sp.]|uniref:hypothetical protein n=1 Tax=Ruminococcus sp. TaxID=41978 RepID=UPI0025D6CD96|nr:hypothetical protein [Ruminococcus sp.]MBQ9542259.1 hypothetical protein [Ruminococcus sp.]
MDKDVVRLVSAILRVIVLACASVGLIAFSELAETVQIKRLFGIEKSLSKIGLPVIGVHPKICVNLIFLTDPLFIDKGIFDIGVQTLYDIGFYVLSESNVLIWGYLR